MKKCTKVYKHIDNTWQNPGPHVNSIVKLVWRFYINIVSALIISVVCDGLIKAWPLAIVGSYVQHMHRHIRISTNTTYTTLIWYLFRNVESCFSTAERDAWL